MQRFINNWTATLTAPAATAAPELSIESVHAAKLVGLGTGDYYLLTLAKVVDEVEVDWEVVKVTAVSAGVLSVERAQEGTVALEWLVGEAVSARFTAAGAEALRESGGASVGDATPQPLGTATPGTSPQASRQDHRHALPTPAAIGAATSAQGALAATAVQPAALASGLDGKVDKVAGKGLSEEDFTAALRSKLVAIEPAAFRGVFASFAALLAGVTSPQPGDFADVDAGAGSDVVRYIWDATDSEWQAGAGGGGPASTDSLPEGATNLYFTVARVLASALTGLSVLTGGSVVSTDSVLAAFGKLQRQINDLTSALGGKQATLVSAENIKTINGASLLGSGDLTVGGVPLPAVQALSSSRSLTMADFNTLNVNSTASAYTVTIPAQASVAWAVDTEIHFLRSGTGAITITASAGVSINGIVAASITLEVPHGAVTLKRIAADSWWMGGVTKPQGDLLSKISYPEVLIAGAATLTAASLGKMHVCSGTSAAYSVALPPVADSAGCMIGFRMSGALTKIVTLTATSIDGQANRSMWAKETAILYCDGSTWTKIAGKSIPMVCEMYPTSVLSVPHSTNTKVPLESTVRDNSGVIADPTTNKRMNIPRGGLWRVQGIAYYQPGTQAMLQSHCRIHINGSLAPLGVNIQTLDTPATDGYFNQHDVVLTLNSGDYVELYAYQSSTSSATRDMYVNSTAFSYLALVEQNSW